MDQTEQKLCGFAFGFDIEQSSQELIDATRLRVIDSIGVALAAMDAPPVAALKDVEKAFAQTIGARIWGTGSYAKPDQAALINGTMVRYLDMNDAYTLISTAHPSDNIAGMISMGEALDRSLADVLEAIIISYEVQCRFCDVAPFHQNGWDQPIVGAPAAALGAAKLLRLNQDQMRHALALALVPNIPMYQTRRGELSMWKNIAGPNGTKIGVNAALMAASGITGPQDVFDGMNGLWAQTLGQRLDVPIPQEYGGHVFAIEQSDIKLFPVRNACQLPVRVALEMRKAVPANRIKKITVWTDEHSFGVPSKDPDLWKPVTRESADHSLPFCVAAALIDGDISLSTFEEKRFLDPDTAHLIDCLSIEFDPDYSQAAPQQRACRLQVEDKDGTRHKVEQIWHEGDLNRLPDAATVAAKFERIANIYGGERRSRKLLEGLQSLSTYGKVSELVDLICAFKSGQN